MKTKILPVIALSCFLAIPSANAYARGGGNNGGYERGYGIARGESGFDTEKSYARKDRTRHKIQEQDRDRDKTQKQYKDSAVEKDTEKKKAKKKMLHGGK